MDRGFWFRRAIASLLLLGLAVPPAGSALLWAQPFRRTVHDFPGEVNVGGPGGKTAEKLLTNVNDFLTAKSWDEAVERLRQVMETHGDALIEFTPGQQQAAWAGRRFGTVRDYCHLRIAALPPEALELYRQRVDAPARRWYDEGIADRDAVKLSRVVDQFFCSSWGDDALLALGEIALEQGHYHAARRYWERIAPALRKSDGSPWWNATAAPQPESVAEQLAEQDEQPQDQSIWLAFPDSELPLADVRARLVLVSILAGEQRRAEWELSVLRLLHPEATGRLGAREVVYQEMLAEMLSESSTWTPIEPDADWPTFGGDRRRFKQTGEPPEPAGMVWDEPIKLGEPLHTDLSAGQLRIAESASALLSYHPVVVDDLLLTATAGRIHAYRLDSGQPAWPSGADEAGDGVFFQLPQLGLLARGYRSRLRLGVPRYTLTVHRDRLYARVGDPVTNRSSEDGSLPLESYLVCLDLAAQGRQVWKITAGQRDRERAADQSWAFEGAPLADDRHVYATLRRGGVSPQAYVACYDAQTGRRLWLQKVCDSPKSLPGEAEEVTHHLLTMVEDTLYYNTSLGAVAALRARDGRMRWVHVYERATRLNLAQPAGYRYRDLTPCLFHRGIVMAAPQDSPHILGLDAASGMLLWRSAPCDAVHLLGVVNNKLIASGRGLYWFDAAQGAIEWVWPEGTLTASDAVRPGLQGWGRGVIAGGNIYWPIRRHEEARPYQILVIDAADARRVRPPIELALYHATAGNLIAAGEHLILATATRLYAFGPQPAQKEPPKSVTGKLEADPAAVQAAASVSEDGVLHVRSVDADD